MQIVHLPVTGCIFSKILFVSKYLHFRLNEKPATGYRFKVFVVAGQIAEFVEIATKMVDAKKWSNMEPMVENHLTMFFVGRIWGPTFSRSSIFKKC